MPLPVFIECVDLVHLYVSTVFDLIDVKVWLLKAFSAWEIRWVVAENKHSFIHSFVLPTLQIYIFRGVYLLLCTSLPHTLFTRMTHNLDALKPHV